MKKPLLIALSIAFPIAALAQTIIQIPLGSKTNETALWWTNATPPTVVSNWQAWKAVNTNLITISNTIAATSNALQTQITGVLPAGVIVMWSGALSSMPSGWALCDGTGGRPDLRDKFIYGWSDGVDPGGTGGAATFTPAGTLSAPTFTGTPFTDIINHTHVQVGMSSGSGSYTGAVNDTSSGGTGGTPSTVNMSISTANPAGGVSSITPAGTVSAPTFSGTESASLPPYYKLAFIIKL